MKILRTKRRVKTKTFKLKVLRTRAAAGKWRLLKVKLGKRARRLVRKSLRRKRVAKARLTVWATDEAGNTTRISRKVKVRKVKRNRRPARKTKG